MAHEVQLNAETIKQIKAANELRLEKFGEYLDATEDQRRLLRALNNSVLKWFSDHDEETREIMDRLMDKVHRIEDIRVKVETDYVWRIVITGVIEDDWVADTVCIIPIDDLPYLIENGWTEDHLKRYCIDKYGQAPDKQMEE